MLQPAADFFRLLNCLSLPPELRSTKLARFPRVHFSRGDHLMLTFWGAKQGFCDGLSRRNFLKVGAFGAGLTLAEMLRQKEAGASVTRQTNSLKQAIMVYLP